MSAGAPDEGCGEPSQPAGPGDDAIRAGSNDRRHGGRTSAQADVTVRYGMPVRRSLAGCPQPLSSAHDTALLDLDGVVYAGGEAIPGAPEALAAARAAGMSLAYVTNNAARTPETVAAHLSDLGVPARPDEVVTSAQAAARLVADKVPTGSRVLVVGGEGLRRALTERGLQPVDTALQDPVAVVQGYAPDVSWRDLAEGAYAVARGVPWVATNTDRTIPTARGIAPGNGTLVAAVAAATGRVPEVAGKPELPLHAEAVCRTRARRPLVVGDRLDTDIEGAVRAGTDSLLVLTGVTTATDLVLAPPHQRPAYVSVGLDGLLRAHPVTHLRAGTATVGPWRATVKGERLVMDGCGDPLDGLRAAAAAVWSSDTPVDVAPALARLGLDHRRTG